MKRHAKRRKKGPTKARIARKLYLEAERLWKGFCHKRDGPVCMVAKRFPELIRNHSTIYQVDHFITRANKNLFFDTRNGTVVCSNCNAGKCWEDKGIQLAIDQIVLEREGSKAVEEMVNKRGPNLDWNRIYWLEEIVKNLKEQMEELESIKNVEAA